MEGEPKVWKGTQDLNDGFRMLTARFVVDDEKMAMATPEQLFLNNQLVPYLSYHISFSLLERTVLKGETLMNPETDTGKAAYYDALRQYIRDARRSINTEATPNNPQDADDGSVCEAQQNPLVERETAGGGEETGGREQWQSACPHIKTETEGTVMENVIWSNDHCVCCGSPVLEGRQVCWACEHGRIRTAPPKLTQEGRRQVGEARRVFSFGKRG